MAHQFWFSYAPPGSSSSRGQTDEEKKEKKAAAEEAYRAEQQQAVALHVRAQHRAERLAEREAREVEREVKIQRKQQEDRERECRSKSLQSMDVSSGFTTPTSARTADAKTAAAPLGRLNLSATLQADGNSSLFREDDDESEQLEDGRGGDGARHSGSASTFTSVSSSAVFLAHSARSFLPMLAEKVAADDRSSASMTSATFFTFFSSARRMSMVAFLSMPPIAIFLSLRWSTRKGTSSLLTMSFGEQTQSGFAGRHLHCATSSSFLASSRSLSTPACTAGLGFFQFFSTLRHFSTNRMTAFRMPRLEITGIDADAQISSTLSATTCETS
ncbi:hypothetical protein FOCC_FOCC017346, partial [Frankliniella occidentalis]